MTEFLTTSVVSEPSQVGVYVTGERAHITFMSRASFLEFYTALVGAHVEGVAQDVVRQMLDVLSNA